MNPPRVYTCSPSWTLLPPCSPYHPSGSSRCTSPEHPVSCIKPGLAIHFTYDIIHVSMPFPQIIPPSPSPSESKRLFYTSVSLLLSLIQGYHNHFSKFHIYALVYCIGVFLSGFLHSVIDDYFLWLSPPSTSRHTGGDRRNIWCDLQLWESNCKNKTDRAWTNSRTVIGIKLHSPEWCKQSQKEGGIGMGPIRWSLLWFPFYRGWKWKTEMLICLP